MKIKNLRDVNWVPQGDIHSMANNYIAEVPVGHLEVGDAIIHQTADNIRKIIDIVPDAKMPDAYVKLHFEDGGGMTMPLKSNASLPSSYRISTERVGRPSQDERRAQRTLGHNDGSYDSYTYKYNDDISNRMDEEGSIFHGVPLTTSNPWLQEQRQERRSGSFKHGSTEHR